MYNGSLSACLAATLHTNGKTNSPAKIGFQDPIDKPAAVTQVQQLHAAILVQCEVNAVTLEVQYTNSIYAAGTCIYIYW